MDPSTAASGHGTGDFPAGVGAPISRLARNRVLRFGIVGGAAAAAAALVTVASTHGPGISRDSVNYVAAARSFANVGALDSFNGRPLTIFPPGLPVLLGLASRVGLDVQFAATALNVVCAALLVVLTYLLARQTQSRMVGVAAALIVGTAFSTIRVYSMLWTEPAFSVLALVVLVVLARAIRRAEISWPQIAVVALATTAATSLRFVGITLLPVVALGVLLAARQRGWTQAALRAAVATAAACLGLGVVAVRNLALGVEPLGDRVPSGVTLTDIHIDSLRTLGAYVIDQAEGTTAGRLGWVVLALLAYAAIRALWRRDWGTVLIAFFVVLYWTAIVYSEFNAIIDPINDRLTAPVFAPVVLMAIYALVDLARTITTLPLPTPLHRGMGVALAIVGAALVAVIVTSSAIRLATFEPRVAESGAGYNSSDSLDSPLASAIATLPASVGVAANDPEHVYWDTGRVPTVGLPKQGRYGQGVRTQAELDALSGLIASGEITRLAFFSADNDVALTPQQLERDGVPLRLVATYSDGALYETHAPDVKRTTS